MEIFFLVLYIAIGVICAIVHKNKGYSIIAGFCWGFFFSIIGLIIVLLEKTKEEHDKEMAEKNGLAMWQWLAIFLGIGIVGIILFVVVISSL